MPVVPTTIKLRLALAALLAACMHASAAPSAATSAMYKCAGIDGRPVYQDAPCADGRELRNFATDPATVSVIPFERAAAASATPPRAPARATPRARQPAEQRTVSRFDPGERRHLREGMSEGEVLARLGPPDVKGAGARSAAVATAFSRSGTQPAARGKARSSSKQTGTARSSRTTAGRQMLWTYLPVPEDAQTMTTVIFENGRVARVDRSVVR